MHNTVILITEFKILFFCPVHRTQWNEHIEQYILKYA